MGKAGSGEQGGGQRRHRGRNRKGRVEWHEPVSPTGGFNYFFSIIRTFACPRLAGDEQEAPGELAQEGR
jgi:hypothetical protein